MDLIGSYVFRIFEFWNRFELDGGRVAALGSLDFPGNFQDMAGVWGRRVGLFLAGRGDKSKR